jgi:hypothetical protein
MAKNQPPSNTTNSTIVMAEGHTIERAPLHDVNGHRVSVTGSKPANLRKLEVLKDIALAKSKRKKLLDLLNNRRLKARLVQLQMSTC